VLTHLTTGSGTDTSPLPVWRGCGYSGPAALRASSLPSSSPSPHYPHRHHLSPSHTFGHEPRRPIPPPLPPLRFFSLLFSFPCDTSLPSLSSPAGTLLYSISFDTPLTLTDLSRSITSTPGAGSFSSSYDLWVHFPRVSSPSYPSLSSRPATPSRLFSWSYTTSRQSTSRQRAASFAHHHE